MREYCIEQIPDATFYVEGLRLLGDRVTPLRRSLLMAHYYAPSRRATAPQLAALANVNGGYPIVNAQYGGLGRAFCESASFEPDLRPSGTPRWWGVWSKGYDHPDGFIWEMHDNVATALESLAWVDPSDSLLFPDELPPTATYVEGAAIQVTANCYERNRSARTACIDHYGVNCTVCGFNFASEFGELGDGFIHVHHLTPISEIGENYVVDPIADLRPVCPNCHAIIHRSDPMLTIDDARRLKR